MSLYRKILVAINLDQECEQILKRALRLAAGSPDNIVIVHACEHPITGYGELTGRNHMVTETQIKQSVFPQLESITQRFGIPRDNVRIEFGQPAEVVNEVATAIGAELIITGSHGKHGLNRLLSSISSSIASSAHCDVLMVNIAE